MKMKKCDYPKEYQKLEDLFGNIKNKGVPFNECMSQKPAAIGLRQTSRDSPWGPFYEELNILLDPVISFEERKSFPLIDRKSEISLRDIVHHESIFFEKEWRIDDHPAKRTWRGFGRVLKPSWEESWDQKIYLYTRLYNLPKFLTISPEKTIVHPITAEELAELGGKLEKK